MNILIFIFIFLLLVIFGIGFYAVNNFDRSIEAKRRSARINFYN